MFRTKLQNRKISKTFQQQLPLTTDYSSLIAWDQQGFWTPLGNSRPQLWLKLSATEPRSQGLQHASPLSLSPLWRLWKNQCCYAKLRSTIFLLQHTGASLSCNMMCEGTENRELHLALNLYPLSLCLKNRTIVMDLFLHHLCLHFWRN